MEITAELRTIKGRSGARRTRMAGKVPGVLYGRGEKTVLIQINEKDIQPAIKAEHFTLKVGKPMDVIVKEVQLECTTSKVLHIDFQHLHRGEKVRIKTPVVLEGLEVLSKREGILEQILSEIEIECLPKDIPEEIRIDVSELNVGDSIHLSDLPPVKGKFLTSLDATVVTVVMPKVVEEKVPLEEEEGEEGEGVAEGEEGTEEKKEEGEGEAKETKDTQKDNK
jgi:large subunit ribosomal protein L25